MLASVGTVAVVTRRHKLSDSPPRLRASALWTPFIPVSCCPAQFVQRSFDLGDEGFEFSLLLTQAFDHLRRRFGQKLLVAELALCVCQLGFKRAQLFFKALPLRRLIDLFLIHQ